MQGAEGQGVCGMEIVILLHGLGRTHRSMAGMARYLERHGYRTLNLHYQSLKKPFSALAEDVAGMIDRSPEFHAAEKVHFLTHSMGGIITRHYLAKHRHKIGGRMGAVVMLGPPNGGSEIADAFHRLWPYKILFGPAGQQLSVAAHQDHLPGEVIDYKLGIIAGTIGWIYPDGQCILNGPHDGRVTVERTKHPAMADHVTVPVAHGFLMFSESVKKYVVNFLKTGVF
jgi:pimeloyl-ACP methyl ester carboxylesterase